VCVQNLHSPPMLWWPASLILWPITRAWPHESVHGNKCHYARRRQCFDAFSESPGACTRSSISISSASVWIKTAPANRKLLRDHQIRLWHMFLGTDGKEDNVSRCHCWKLVKYGNGVLDQWTGEITFCSKFQRSKQGLISETGSEQAEIFLAAIWSPEIDG
jgi:hypothetical protein